MDEKIMVTEPGLKADLKAGAPRNKRLKGRAAMTKEKRGPQAGENLKKRIVNTRKR